MKKLTVLLFLISSICYSQNMIGVQVQPSELGIGLRFQTHNIYTSATYGNYKLPDNSFVDDHYKIAAGIVKKTHYDGYNTFISFGASFHSYGISEGITEDAFAPISAEFGAGASYQHFTIGFVFDPLKGEGGIFTGINF